MRLYQLSQQDVEEREKELEELNKTMNDLKSILSDSAKVSAIIKEELAALNDKYGDETDRFHLGIRFRLLSCSQ